MVETKLKCSNLLEKIAKWNISTSTWSALVRLGNNGVGTMGYVYTVAIDSINNVYIGGSFSSAGGISTNNIAKWDGSTWLAVGIGISNAVLSIAIDSSDNAYVSGFFDMINGVSGYKLIAKWNGSTWSKLGDGLQFLGTTPQPPCSSIAIDNGNNVYACGEFTTASGITVNRVAKWNGTSWSRLGTGVGGTSANAIAINKNNYTIYVGGNFTTVGTLPSNYITQYSYYENPTITGSFYSPISGNDMSSITISSVTQIKWTNGKWNITNINEIQNKYPPIYTFNGTGLNYIKRYPLTMNCDLRGGAATVNISHLAGNVHIMQINCNANVTYSGICFVTTASTSASVASMGIFDRNGETRYAVTSDYTGDTNTGNIQRYVPFISPWRCPENDIYLVSFYTKTGTWPLIDINSSSYFNAWGQANKNMNPWDAVMTYTSVLGTGQSHPTNLVSLTGWVTTTNTPILVALV